MHLISVGNICRILFIMVASGINEFDLELAKRYASVSSAMYCDDMTVVADWSCVNCQDSKFKVTPGKVKVLDAGLLNSSRVIVAGMDDKKSCLLAFRGTDNWENWLQDLQYSPQLPSKYEHCEGCKVHGGFQDIWKSLRPQVTAALGQVGCPWLYNSKSPYNLYITGHSMGAAVAQLAMFTVDELKYNIVSSYLFEAPRVGNQAFKNAFQVKFKNTPVFRITHHKDPVVHLPPMWVGFIHAGEEVYFGANGTDYKICKDESNLCSDQFSNVVDMLQNAHEHCESELVRQKNICWPIGCLNTKNKTKNALTVVV